MIDYLLKVIAATVASDPVKYSEAFLGKSNQEYCSWIQDPEKWGGAVNFFFSLNKHAFVSARQLQEHGSKFVYMKLRNHLATTGFSSVVYMSSIYLCHSYSFIRLLPVYMLGHNQQQL